MSELQRTYGSAYSLEVQALIDDPRELVPAAALAPVVHMHPSVIIGMAKEGSWSREHQCNYIIAGKRVKFYRLDFLKKGGWV